MTTINLKRYYPYMTENVMLEVSDEIAATLPAGWGVLGRTRPIFRKHDVLAIGALPTVEPASRRTAAAPEVTR